MFFTSRKRFEEAVEKKAIEARERDWQTERIYKLEDRISKLEYKVAKLEGNKTDERKTVTCCPSNIEDIEI